MIGYAIVSIVHACHRMIDRQAVKVEETGQKNTVLTLYELIEGETTSSQGMLPWTMLYRRS